MLDKYLMDIPIYWCDEEKFWANYHRRLSNHLAAYERETGYQLKEPLRTILEDSFWRSYIAPWRFNQIVGWVRVFHLGSQLRGELWYMNAKRAGRQLTKKQFSLQGKAFELNISRTATSKEICQLLKENLEQCEADMGKGRVLDLEMFNELGGFVDWRKLMDQPLQVPSERDVYDLAPG